MRSYRGAAKVSPLIPEHFEVDCTKNSGGVPQNSQWSALEFHTQYVVNYEVVVQ